MTTDPDPAPANQHFAVMLHHYEQIVAAGGVSGSGISMQLMDWASVQAERLREQLAQQP